jgi:hypothetical protein
MPPASSSPGRGARRPALPSIHQLRNVKSPHWRRWLGPASRCVVPFTSFGEYADTKPRNAPTWFALHDSRPLAAFAGIWTPWNGTRATKANPVVGERQLSASSRRRQCRSGCDPSEGDAGDPDRRSRDRTLMTALAEKALKLQHPLPMAH